MVTTLIYVYRMFTAGVVKNAYFHSSATLSASVICNSDAIAIMTLLESVQRQDYHGNQWLLDCHRIKISTYYVYTHDLLQIFAEEHQTSTSVAPEHNLLESTHNQSPLYLS